MAYVFINRYFYPDHSATSQMLSDLAFALADNTVVENKNAKVRIITSCQRYDAADARLTSHEIIKNVEIHRVWTSRFGRTNLVGRAIDYVTFYLSATWALWRIVQSGDVVIAKTDPPMMSILVAPVVRWRGAKLVNWLQDLFPEVAQVLNVGAGRMASLGYGVLRRWRNTTLRGAAMNVAIGTRMAEKLAANGISPSQIQIIPNWADGQLVQPVRHASNGLRVAWGLEHFVVGYSGNLGRAHEYTTLLDAITTLERQLQNEPLQQRIVWLFIGGGTVFENFRAAAQKRGLTSIAFKPYQPRELLCESLSAIDLHLVSLRSELEGLVVPSKHYGIIAAGRPAVFIGDLDGEVARAHARIGCGVSVPEGDSAALMAVIVRLAGAPDTCCAMGLAARNAFENEFDKPIAVAKWRKLLRAVDGQR
jgi:colanic acid biosynthesis glycosyl transferase WcaI